MSVLEGSVADHHVLRKLGASAGATGFSQETLVKKQQQALSLSPGSLAIVLQVAASLIWIGQAALLAVAIGHIVDGVPASRMIWPALAVFLLGVVRAALERTGARLAFQGARRELFHLRKKAVAALAPRSPLDISNPSSGFVASTLAEQAEALVPYIARFQPLRWRAIIVPLAIFSCVFPLSWVAALVMLIALPLIPLFMALIGWQAKEASARQLARLGDMNGFLLDRLRGLATIRSFDAVERTALRLREEAQSLRRRTMAVLRIAFLSSAVLELFAALGVAMVAVYVGFHFLGQLDFGAWGNRLTLTQGVFILMLAPAFFEPMREISAVWHDRAAGLAALEALEKASIIGEPMVVAGAETMMAQEPGVALSVSLDGVHFSHAGQSHKVFEGLFVHIRAGERVAVMAPSGGGKSTLLALIAGLAVAEAGAIHIGGEKLSPQTMARLRAATAWLGQSPHIFAKTLASNVRMGRPHLDVSMVEAALKAVRLDGVACERGSELLGEGGAGLSGGETLRLAIARAAVVQNTGLVLADEPTAHLDRTTANEIADMLLELAKGRTLVVATHDRALAARMDRIITLGDLACKGGGK